MRTVWLALFLAAGCTFDHGSLGGDATPRDAPPTTNCTSSSWLDPAWTQRKRITIAAAMVEGGSPLAAFPVLIDVGADPQIVAGAQPDHDDIVFTLADGVSRAPHELEIFNTSVVAWVKVDLAAATDTALYVYYGNATAPSQQNRPAVWSDNYIGVWHFAQSPVGTAPQVLDSTASGLHATSRGMMASDHVAGRIAGGLQFASDNGLDAPSTTLGPSFSYEAWINTDDITNWRCIINNNPFHNRWLGTYQGDLDFYSGTEHIQTTGLSVTGGWYHVAITYDDASLRHYLDGTLLGAPVSLNYGNATSPIQIGYTDTSLGEWFVGQIDEVRISSVARPAGYLATVHRNVTMPSLIQLGGAEVCR